jgi:acyl-coenzyme A thioesterase PaaI-like protein
MRANRVLEIEPHQHSGHAASLGIEILEAGPGWAKFSLEWRDELMARSISSVPASAPILSLMESACGHAVWSAIEQPLSQLILSLRVDHLRSATPGRRLIGQAECFRVTKRIAFARGIAYDDDKNDPVVNATASFFYKTRE